MMLFEPPSWMVWVVGAWFLASVCFGAAMGALFKKFRLLRR
jgi:hypothetical protein